MAAIARPQRKISPELENLPYFSSQECANYIDTHPKLKNLSEFNQLVLFETVKFTTSEVIFYAKLARRINHPKVCRTVGNVLSKNP